MRWYEGANTKHFFARWVSIGLGGGWLLERLINLAVGKGGRLGTLLAAPQCPELSVPRRHRFPETSR